MTVTGDELDRAMLQGKLQLTRANARAVRCCHCRRLCAPGKAARCWIDGHKRGFLCNDVCGKGLKGR